MTSTTKPSAVAAMHFSGRAKTSANKLSLSRHKYSCRTCEYEGTAVANQIALDDLLVYVEDNKVKLWSQSRLRQVLSRLSCAHNFSQRSLGIYRFLATLGQQYGLMPQFSLLASLRQSKFMPRIMMVPVILAEASWEVPYLRFVGLVVAGQSDRTAWQFLQQEYQLDEWVT